MSRYCFINKTLKNFQYISDLHLEYKMSFPIISSSAENLLLAGDIGNPFLQNYKNYLKYCSYSYENIFLIPGNHEYWNFHGKEITDNEIDYICSNFTNVFNINKRFIESNNCFILGCTLWTYLKTRHKSYYLDVNQLNSEDIVWLKNSLSSLKNNSKKKNIIMTHHLPTFDLIDNKYKKFSSNYILEYFANNLDDIIKPPIDVWICGHTHTQKILIKNGVFMGINAIGNENINDNYIKTFTI